MQAVQSPVTNYPAIGETYKYNVKLCNIWACGIANKTCTWLAILSVYEQHQSK